MIVGGGQGEIEMLIKESFSISNLSIRNSEYIVLGPLYKKPAYRIRSNYTDKGKIEEWCLLGCYAVWLL
jgi:hypothetical protein